MIFIHYLACLVQILYTIYNLFTWYTRRAIMWGRANWRKRARFIECYRPSTEEERLYEEEMKNHSNIFRYVLKRRMLLPREPADESDPIWGDVNKKYNVDNRNKQ